MVHSKKSKTELLKKLRKFKHGWSEISTDLRMDFKTVERQVIEYFEKTGHYALKRGKLTLNFKEWLYQNSERYTIHSPP